MSVAAPCKATTSCIPIQIHCNASPPQQETTILPLPSGPLHSIPSRTCRPPTLLLRFHADGRVLSSAPLTHSHIPLLPFFLALLTIALTPTLTHVCMPALTHSLTHSFLHTHSLRSPALGAADGGDQLASEFAAHVNQLALKAPLQHRRPSPLEPPTAAVAAQMDALQINDWPEPDAGVNTAVRGRCSTRGGGAVFL